VIGRALAAMVLLGACSAASGKAGEAILPADRPAIWVDPPADAETPVPIVVLLHGYGSDARQHLLYLGGVTLAQRGAVVVAPEGTPDASGRRFWNVRSGTFDGPDVDDLAYLDALRRAAIARGGDPARVWLIGHSNGAYMAYRYACTYPERTRGVVAIAGSLAADCPAGAPVEVIHAHGVRDRVIPFEGGPLGPGARDVAARWAARNGCGERKHSGFRTDYQDCPPRGSVTLHTLIEDGHVPKLGPGWVDVVWSHVSSPE
jgi:polyhydroxybutyrate depolymerase